MRRTITILIALMGAFALAACAGSGSGSGSGGGGPITITSAHWEQQQAIEGFDSAPGDTTDAAELGRLAEIIDSHDLQGQDPSFGETCPGGRVTQLSYVTDAGDEHSISVAGCDRGDAGDAIDTLVNEWRTNR